MPRTLARSATGLAQAARAALAALLFCTLVTPPAFAGNGASKSTSSLEAALPIEQPRLPEEQPSIPNGARSAPDNQPVSLAKRARVEPAPPAAAAEPAALDSSHRFTRATVVNLPDVLRPVNIPDRWGALGEGGEVPNDAPLKDALVTPDGGLLLVRDGRPECRFPYKLIRWVSFDRCGIAGANDGLQVLEADVNEEMQPGVALGARRSVLRTLQAVHIDRDDVFFSDAEMQVVWRAKISMKERRAGANRSAMLSRYVGIAPRAQGDAAAGSQDSQAAGAERPVFAKDTPLWSPAGLADYSGRVLFVADTANHVVLGIDMWNTRVERQLSVPAPVGLAIDKSNLYVTSKSTNRIYVIDLTTNEQRVFAGNGEASAALGSSEPLSAAIAEPGAICAGDSGVYVSYAGGSIARIAGGKIEQIADPAKLPIASGESRHDSIRGRGAPFRMFHRSGILMLIDSGAGEYPPRVIFLHPEGSRVPSAEGVLTHLRCGDPCAQSQIVELMKMCEGRVQLNAPTRDRAIVDSLQIANEGFASDVASIVADYERSLEPDPDHAGLSEFLAGFTLSQIRKDPVGAAAIDAVNKRREELGETASAYTPSFCPSDSGVFDWVGR